jgi:isopentenyl diphosphate isomerase/L-lactate dehydrogenase-like FMN-dependent dehydrogenase
VDLSVEVFGQRLSSPIFLCPVGAQLMFHPEGEVAVARAAKTKNALQVLSTVTNFSVEDVARARGGPGWFQLYTTSDWAATLGMVKRAEDAGCTALAWTVDIPVRNLEPVARFNRDVDPVCQACHAGMPDAFSLRHMFDGIDMTKVRMGLGGLTWDYLERLKGATSMKVLVKGVVTREDAARCLEHGADGIVVSNHGGRSDETLRGAIDSLPEVVAAVGGRIPVFVDSGFRRGTDIFKALALGATRRRRSPHLGLRPSAGGVERVLDILTRELRIDAADGRGERARNLVELARACLSPATGSGLHAAGRVASLSPGASASVPWPSCSTRATSHPCAHARSAWCATRAASSRRPGSACSASAPTASRVTSGFARSTGSRFHCWPTWTRPCVAPTARSACSASARAASRI